MTETSALFNLPAPPTETETNESVRKWTERDMLDLLHERYGQKSGNGPRYVLAEHVRNQGGFGGWDIEHFQSTGKRTTLRTADAMAVDLWPSSNHPIHGFEVKVSRSDWLAELKDATKAEAFKPYCDHWWLVVPDAAIVRDDLPADWGLLAVGGDGRLRAARRAPKLDRQDMPVGLMAAWLRATVKTTARRAA